MTKANTQSNLARVQDALLVEMSAMQARLPTDIVLTPQGGTFTAGRVALALYYIRLPMPEIADG